MSISVARGNWGAYIPQLNAFRRQIRIKNATKTKITEIAVIKRGEKIISEVELWVTTRTEKD